MGFWTIIGGIVVFNVAWWAWAHVALRRSLLRQPAWLRLASHAGLLAFMGAMVGGFAWLFLVRFSQVTAETPLTLLVAIYLWHLLVLPIATILMAWDVFVSLLGRAIGVLRRLRGSAPVQPAVMETPAGLAMSRRQVLVAAAVVGPPLLTGSGVLTALSQQDRFRVRKLRLAVPRLPTALEGVRIVHISDLHVGKFSNAPLLASVAERVNELRPDLIAVTGDLIDFNLDDLPLGLSAMQKLNARHGVWMCEGNHDLFQGRDKFEEGVRRGGVPLLLNQGVTLGIHGRDVRLMGLRWGWPGGGRSAAIEDNLREVAAEGVRGDVSVLLAHHPHAFDAAAEAGIDITLAGHTHGGQLMVSETIGAGPVLYKYWSGLYRRGDSSLVVSNGTGNWYPLRINAPAEILELTLVASA